MNFSGTRIQPRTLLPQFRNAIDKPSIRDENIESHRFLNEVIPEVTQGICLFNNVFFIKLDNFYKVSCLI